MKRTEGFARQPPNNPEPTELKDNDCKGMVAMIRDTPTAPLTVLLVEDNPDHAELVLRNFEGHPQARVCHITDGEAALDYLFQRGVFQDGEKHPRPHVILLDLRLPKVDGLEVLRAIRGSAELNNIPVVVLTTSRAGPDVDRAYQRHVNSYLVKPLDFDDFTQLMHDLGCYWLDWNQYPQPTRHSGPGR